MSVSFDGRVTIRVRFKTRAEYEKFRKYILKTNWSYDLDYPMWEELTLDFHCIDDLETVNRHIVGLLQLGFEVYCCRYQLEQHLAEEQVPTEEDIPEDEWGLDDFDIKKMVGDLWKKCGNNLNKSAIKASESR